MRPIDGIILALRKVVDRGDLTRVGRKCMQGEQKETRGKGEKGKNPRKGGWHGVC